VPLARRTFTLPASARSWVGEVARLRDVLALLIDRITPVRVGHAKYHVRVTWTPLGESLRRLAERAGAVSADAA
jgi:hypothetical protein